MPVPFPNDGESWIPAKKMLKNRNILPRIAKNKKVRKIAQVSNQG